MHLGNRNGVSIEARNLEQSGRPIHLYDSMRDRLRAWDVEDFSPTNFTHKICGIFVASWGVAHCIGTRLVFHDFLSQHKEDK